MSALALPHGIHRDVSPSVYHARELGVVSKSALDRVARSPAHYKAWVDGPEEETRSRALAFGAALHVAFLEPARFGREYVIEPDFGDCRKKDNKAARDAWRAANAGFTVLPSDDHAALVGMSASLRSHPFAARTIEGGDAELTLRWRDSETGLECKGRADYHVPRLRMAVDIKTTEDASTDAFRRSVVRYGYHRQHALYSEGFAACGAPLDHFVFLALEKEPPYAIALFTIDVAAIAKGRLSIRRDMQTLADCLAKGEWPSYAPGIQSLTLPEWAA